MDLLSHIWSIQVVPISQESIKYVISVQPVHTSSSCTNYVNKKVKLKRKKWFLNIFYLRQLTPQKMGVALLILLNS